MPENEMIRKPDSKFPGEISSRGLATVCTAPLLPGSWALTCSRLTRRLAFSSGRRPRGLRFEASTFPIPPQSHVCDPSFHERGPKPG